MSRGYSTDQQRSPTSAFGLLLFGVLAFGGATLSPTSAMLEASTTAMLTGGPLVGGGVLAMSGGLLVISLVSIGLGFALLMLRT